MPPASENNFRLVLTAQGSFPGGTGTELARIPTNYCRSGADSPLYCDSRPCDVVLADQVKDDNIKLSTPVAINESINRREMARPNICLLRMVAA